MSGSVLGIISLAGTVQSFLQNISLRLGSIEFSGTEVPENFGSLGGNQRLAIHEFPGGFRSAQTFGAFPADTIAWRGILSGANALSRATDIGRLYVAGQPIVLAYAGFAWLGYVSRWSPHAKHQWWVPYDIAFEPVQDLSGAATPITSSQTPESQLTDQTTALNDYQAGDPLPTPTSLFDPVNQLLGDVQSALAPASGIISNVSAIASSTIGAGVSTITALAAPLIQSTDSGTASASLAVLSRSTIIGTLFAAPAATVDQLVGIVNPNLFQLAAQYYGDPSQWTLIATANNLLDPQPTGTFTLTIPAEA